MNTLPDPIDVLADKQMCRLVLAFLSPRNALIMRLHFGIGEPVHNGREIADIVHLSKARVHQLVGCEVRRLRFLARRVLREKVPMPEILRGFPRVRLVKELREQGYDPLECR